MPSRPRTRRPLTSDDLVRLRALYDDRSVSLQKVAAEFAIPVSTLLRWVAEMEWPRRREGGKLPAPTLSPAPPASQIASEAPQPEPAPTRPPRLEATLESVPALARRGLADLAAHRPRSFEERERVARLVASLTRSLERVGESLRRERQRAQARRHARDFGRELRALRLAEEAVRDSEAG